MCHNCRYPDPPEATKARIKSRMNSETRAAYAYVGFIALILFYLVTEIMK